MTFFDDAFPEFRGHTIEHLEFICGFWHVVLSDQTVSPLDKGLIVSSNARVHPF